NTLHFRAPLYSLRPRAPLPSVPTRRSSDLLAPVAAAADRRLARRPRTGAALGAVLALGFALAAVLVVSGDYYRASRLTRTFGLGDRKSTRLNSSHVAISYAVFCLKKKMRPFDREQRDIMFFLQGRAEIFLRDVRAGLPVRRMRLFVHGYNHLGRHNLGVLLPPRVA